MIISVFLGVITSLLVSFENTKILSIYFFIISFSILLVIYIIHRKKSNSEIKKLIKEQENCILRLYDFRQITKKQLEDYAKRGLLSYNKVLQLLEDTKKKLEEQAVEIMNLQNKKLEGFYKTKIIYKNNKEEICEKAFVDQTNKQILILGTEGTLSKIIFVDFAEVKSVEIIK